MATDSLDGRVLIPLIVPCEEPQIVAEWIENILLSVEYNQHHAEENEDILDTATPFTIFSIFQDDAATYAQVRPNTFEFESAVISMWTLLNGNEKAAWSELLDDLRIQFQQVCALSFSLTSCKNGRGSELLTEQRTEMIQDYKAKVLKNLTDRQVPASKRSRKLGEGTRKRKFASLLGKNLLDRIQSPKKDKESKTENESNPVDEIEKCAPELECIDITDDTDDDDGLDLVFGRTCIKVRENPIPQGLSSEPAAFLHKESSTMGSSSDDSKETAAIKGISSDSQSSNLHAPVTGESATGSSPSWVHPFQTFSETASNPSQDIPPPGPVHTVAEQSTSTKAPPSNPMHEPQTSIPLLGTSPVHQFPYISTLPSSHMRSQMEWAHAPFFHSNPVIPSLHFNSASNPPFTNNLILPNQQNRAFTPFFGVVPSFGDMSFNMSQATN
ncbi:hypothetical protein CPB86DRAFT_820323 [Serendipita vermifera]|nr:hypothetical protein CPB86DRAFT_820323 [Serendipita vermifera]